MLANSQILTILQDIAKDVKTIKDKMATGDQRPPPPLKTTIGLLRGEVIISGKPHLGPRRKSD